MKILIFSQAYYPNYIGGAEIAVKEITDRLGDGFEFDLITLRRGEVSSERIGNVTVYRTGPAWAGNSFLRSWKIYKYLFPFFAFYTARKLNKKRRYDLTWAIMASYSGFAGLLFKLFYRNTPFLLTLQEGDSIAYIKKQVILVYPLFKLIFTKADRIQAISKFLADFGQSMGHKNAIDVIPNGVDVKKFSEEIPESVKESLKSRLNKKAGDIFLVTTSRLVYKNATDDIISSLPYLPDNISLIVIGKGEQGPMLKKLASKLGVEGRVQFLGFIPYDEIPKYFSACDIFVRPSRSEGFGNSFIEAMAAGLPVIATSVGGITDFLKDGETGVFCEPENPQSVAEAVKRLIADPELVKKVRENGLKMVTERYDWDLIASQIKSKVFNNS